MVFKSLKKVEQGKYLTYYVAEYINELGHTKYYEFFSRDNNLTAESFGKNVPTGVGMVTFSVDRSKVLLLKEFRLPTKRWVYNFPGGLIDEGETPEQASKREIFEETGLTLVQIEAVLPPSYASPATSDELMHIVIGRCQGEIKPSCFEDEEIQAGWYDKEQIKKLLEEGAYMSTRTQMFLYMWAYSEE